MKRVFQWIILLAMVFGAFSLSSCSSQLKEDMMTPGGLVNGSGGGSGGSGGSGGGGGGGTNPGGGGGGGTNPGGGGGGGEDPGGGGGGGGTNSELMTFLNYTSWQATDNTETQFHSLYFRDGQLVYNEMTETDDINFIANYSASGNTLSFTWTAGYRFDEEYNPIDVNINNYSLPKTATVSSDRKTISFGGRTYEQD